MTENMKKFLEIVSANQELAEKAVTMDNAALIALAKEQGITLTDADFAQPEAMNENELENVAGGGDCYCVVGGGGTKGDKDNVCVCTGYGMGTYYGKATATGEEGSQTRCTCIGYGGGGSVDD